MRKVSARRRFNIATNHLSRFSKEGRDFLSRIVAIDETWVRSYEPELKRQSAEWHTPTGLGIKTASYPTKCKQTPPSWSEKCMFLFITFFVGND
jgi:hypothetical protein